MNRDISKEQGIIDQFLDKIGLHRKAGDQLSIDAVWRSTIIRADGTIEEKVIRNQLHKDGLNAIASRLIADTTSPAGWMAVGSGTAASSLGSVGLIHETVRKAGATITTSLSTVIMVCTFGGAADSVTSVALEEASLVNHVNSGQGTFVNKVIGVAATLANSDLLNLQCEIQVGSHNIA